jgi:hypothetical protein
VQGGCRVKVQSPPGGAFPVTTTHLLYRDWAEPRLTEKSVGKSGRCEQMSKVQKFQFEDSPPAKDANLAKTDPKVNLNLATLATLAAGGDKKTISHPNGEAPKASGKSVSICPQCQGEIFLRTSFGKKFCYQCLCEMKAEIGKDTNGFTEVDLVLEEAVEKAEERSAILEQDGGLERKQADETARVLHIQPAIGELIRRGLIFIEGGPPGAQISDIPDQAPDQPTPANSAKVAKLYSGEAARASSPELILTCFECPLHEHDPVNPREGWGRCTIRNHGCYGLKPACNRSQRQKATKTQTDKGETVS